jgi:uracil-DNA glycosylase family 4
MTTTLENLQVEVCQCNACPRLVKYRQDIAVEKRRQFASEEYWGRPVPGFGDPNAELLIVGLAPAAHGGNRTGRVFTGDRSGDFLFKCLYKTGFANQPNSTDRRDGLQLKGAYITASVKCAPPENKPLLQETISCSSFLIREIEFFPRLAAYLCLGQFAYDSLLRILNRKYRFESPPKFGHGVEFRLGQDLPIVYVSYHPSPRNTQTGTLTEQMMLTLLRRIKRNIYN